MTNLERLKEFLVQAGQRRENCRSVRGKKQSVGVRCPAPLSPTIVIRRKPGCERILSIRAFQIVSDDFPSAGARHHADTRSQRFGVLGEGTTGTSSTLER